MEKSSRNKCPGIRLIGGRIYDSENGKTCHQCRQKTRDFTAQCKNQKEKKVCSINFCHKCLLNRYGEKAADVALLKEWSCPKCRDICNCSFCMKRRGHKPTGLLVHTAKQHGFSSVSDMLKFKEALIPKRASSSDEEPVAVLSRKQRKENSFDGDCIKSVKSQEKLVISNESPLKKTKRGRPREIINTNVNDKLRDIINNNVDDNGSLMECRLRKHGAKKPKICEEVYKKEVKTSDKDGGEFEEKKESETQVLKAASFDMIQNEERTRGMCKDARTLIDSKTVKFGYCKPSNDASCKDADIPVDVASISGRRGRKAVIEPDRFSKVPNCRDDILTSYCNANGGSSLNTTLEPFAVSCDANYQDESVLQGIRSNNDEAKRKVALDSCHFKTSAAELLNEKFDAKVQLPTGSRMTVVEDTLLPPEDVGHALQFLEFCASFGKVLNLKKGNAGIVIKEIVQGPCGHRSQYSILTWIHIRLLSLILKDKGERPKSLNPIKGQHPWVQALGKLVSEYPYMSSEFLPDCFNGDIDEYGKQTITKKFKLLNFLCDEALGTKQLRMVIDDHNSKFLLGEKEAKEKVSVAKEKKKLLKQKMQDELAKAIMAKNGASLSVSEHEDLVSQIKREAAEAQKEMLEAKGMVPKTGQRSDAVRTEPILSDTNGSRLWKLKCYTGEPNVLLQDMGTLDSDAHYEYWYSYDADQKEEIEKYISSLKTKHVLCRRHHGRLAA